MAREWVMAATRMVGDTKGVYRQQLLQGVTCPENVPEWLKDYVT